jgi:hypothetical protein
VIQLNLGAGLNNAECEPLFRPGVRHQLIAGMSPLFFNIGFLETSPKVRLTKPVPGSSVTARRTRTKHEREERDYIPRVLVINGDPFCKTSASGLTMTNLFRGWPTERLAQVFTSAFAVDSQICKSFWRFPPQALISPDKGYKIDLRNAGCGNLPNCSPSQKLAAQSSPEPLLPWFGGGVRRETQAAMDLFSYRLSEQFWKWVRDFDPEVVYSYFGCIRIMRLSFQVATELDLPIVPHFMDDWPSTLYRNSQFSFLLRPKLAGWLNQCLTRAPMRMAIGTKMAEEFEKRYGPPFHPLMNCVDDERLDSPVSEPPSRNTIRFVYVGGLHLNRWKSLCDIGLALKGLQSQGIMGELVIYGKVNAGVEMNELLRLQPVIRLKGSIPVADVPAAQEDADCLVHVESFESADRQYTRLSVSTKIPEYLASGRPILVYGPSETASVQYVEQTGCGRVVGERNDTLLSEALAAVIRSHGWRLQRGHRAKGLAGMAHRASSVREGLRLILAAAVNSRPTTQPELVNQYEETLPDSDDSPAIEEPAHR